MKYLSFFISAMFIYCLFSCADNVIEVVDDNRDIATRSIVDVNHSSISNPDLLTNWENIEYVVLNTVNADETYDRVTLPWHDGSQTLLPPNFRHDIKVLNYGNPYYKNRVI